MKIRQLLEDLRGVVTPGDESYLDESSMISDIGKIMVASVQIPRDDDYQQFIAPIVSAYESGAGPWDLKDPIEKSHQAYKAKYPLQVVNCTPHPIVMVRESISNTYVGQELRHHIIHTYKTSGNVARVSMTGRYMPPVDGFNVSSETPGPVVGLPVPIKGTWYIVSAMVRTALPERKDLLSPGKSFRDADGNIIGIYNFIGNP